MSETEIHRGSHVVVRDAFGRDLPKRALTGLIAGGDFAVVWACSEQEWTTAEAEGRDPEGIPWPGEDVRLAEVATTGGGADG